MSPDNPLEAKPPPVKNHYPKSIQQVPLYTVGQQKFSLRATINNTDGLYLEDRGNFMWKDCLVL